MLAILRKKLIFVNANQSQNRKLNSPETEELNRLKNLLFVILCVLTAAVITGCSEIEDPVTTDFTADGEAFGTVGEMKMPADAAPGAPQLQIPEGTPTVKSVGYFSDWQLTKSLTGTVPVGKTIFVKVAFSEGMQLVVADDQTARPVLYRRVNRKLARFNIANFGAGGEDFVSGDAKPVKTKKTFLCKYTVQPTDEGEFVFAVGRLSADLQGNLLPAFYTHKEKLQCGPAKSPKQEKTDTTPPTVVSITHYHDDGEIIPEGESVAHNTTVKTTIVFSESIAPESVVVTSTTGGKTKRFSYSTRSVHWRGTFQVSRDKRTVCCKQLAREDSFVVTLEAVKDLAGNALAELVTAPEIVVTSHAVVTTPEPTQLETPVQTPVETTPPTVPDQPTPQPNPTAVQAGEYTFSFDGHTYPGYNPSPKLQHILNTHPSAKLPFFEEAVKRVEVMSWTYRKSWELYIPGEEEKRGEVIKKVRMKFGMATTNGLTLRRAYFDTPPNGFPPLTSAYWFFVEYQRLSMQYPGKSEWEVLMLFKKNKESVVGITNPNS